MSFELSDVGRKLTGHSGIFELMDDLDAALNGERPMLMLGGGNPGRIPEVEEALRQALAEICAEADTFYRAFGIYDNPIGSSSFIGALAELLSEELNSEIGPERIALTNGSQNSFFGLFNMLGGACRGAYRRILLPMVPEYIGYADVGLGPDLFVSRPARMEALGPHRFKYRIDFDALPAPGEGTTLGAVCVSRPTNPTGNVLERSEVARLSGFAQAHGVPLIVDGAYGEPFPGLVHARQGFDFEDHMILTLSLSKLGFPGARTGIVVAPERITTALGRMNAITSLSTGSLGPATVEGLVRSGALMRLSRTVLQPHYRARALAAERLLDESMAACAPGCDYSAHACEGAFFMWVRFPGLPISAADLYMRLKERGVIVVPGHHYYPGLEAGVSPAEMHECLRISYAQDEPTVRRGLEIIATTVGEVFS